MYSKRLLATILSLLILFTTIPGVAVAQNDGDGGGGIDIPSLDDIKDGVREVVNSALGPVKTGINDLQGALSDLSTKVANLPQQIYDKLPDIVKDPIGTAQSWVSGLLSWAVSGFVSLFGDIVELATYVPAPGNPTDPSTWVPVDGNGNAKNTLWGDVYEATKINIALAIIMLAFSGALNFRYSNAVRRRKAWKAWVLCFSMVFLTWFIAPFGLHIASTLSDGLAPGANEFLGSLSKNFSGFGKFGYGLFINLIIVTLFPAIGFIGLLVIAVQVFLLFLVIYLWPIGWAALSFKEGYLHSIGQFIINLYAGLLVLNVGQAMILRLLFKVDFTQVSIQGSIMSLLMIPGGVLFATVLLPYAMVKQITMGAGVNLGMRNLSYQAENAGRHYENAERRYEKRKRQIKKTGRDAAETLATVGGAFSSGDSGDGPPPGGGGGAVARIPRGRGAASGLPSGDSGGGGGATSAPPADRGTSANPIALPRTDTPPEGRPTGNDSSDGGSSGRSAGNETSASADRASRSDNDGDRSVYQRMSRERRRREQIRRDHILRRDDRRR